MSAVEEPAAERGRHLVQFYEADEPALIANVGRYLADGLLAGEHVIVVTTSDHEAAFTAALERAGIPTLTARADGRLMFLDAAATLKRLSVAGYPDAERFENVIGRVVCEARQRAPGLRAYGEMVGILWANGEFPAAIRLEQLWHRLLKQVDFSLFCGYPIDIFSDRFEPGVVDALLCAHTHLLSCSPNSDLEEALERAAREVLQPKVTELSGMRRPAWPDMPHGEAIILWLRGQTPDVANEILNRARKYYREARAVESGSYVRSSSMSARVIGKTTRNSVP
jgi:hypothetical protein